MADEQPGTDARDERPAFRYAVVIAAVPALLLVVFLLVQAMAPAVLADPTPVFAAGGPTAAGLGVGLLVADLLLPVPASVVMTVHGALFGVAAGTALSTAGAVGAALVGYALGRWAGPPVLSRMCSAAERDRAGRLLRRWGLLAVVATRPIPLLAETVALMAGAERLGLLRTVAATLAGAVPTALAHAIAGAHGTSGPAGPVVIAMALAASALLWLVPRAVDRHLDAVRRPMRNPFGAHRRRVDSRHDPSAPGTGSGRAH